VGAQSNLNPPRTQPKGTLRKRHSPPWAGEGGDGHLCQERVDLLLQGSQCCPRHAFPLELGLGQLPQQVCNLIVCGSPLSARLLADLRVFARTSRYRFHNRCASLPRSTLFSVLLGLATAQMLVSWRVAAGPWRDDWENGEGAGEARRLEDCFRPPQTPAIKQGLKDGPHVSTSMTLGHPPRTFSTVSPTS
jgi:hypothetical protein